MPAVDAFRVLIMDDEPAMCLEASNAIMQIEGDVPIYVDHAYTPRVAIAKVKEVIFDLIVLDLYRNKDLVGYELCRHLSELGCSVEVLLMTRFDLDPSAKVLMSLFAGEGGPRLVGFLDKREQETTDVGEEVRKRYERFVAASLSTSNLEFASRIIDRRRSRYERHRYIPGRRVPSFPLRAEPIELHAEIERLLRVLYVEIPRWADRSVTVSVALEPMDRRGLSAAVTVNAVVNIGLKDASEIRTGHKTVLKIGPKFDILEEASRYREFVRYGVELDQRVELLAVAGKDSLGALVYSFAGGLHRKQLLSLDEVLIADLIAGDVSLSVSVLERLFSSRHWYDIRTPDINVSLYFIRSYKTELLRSCSTSEGELRKLPELIGERVRVKKVERTGIGDAHFVLSVGDATELVIPDSSVLGVAPMYRPARGCLVHGDMHAGNVMLEASADESVGVNVTRPIRLERVSLIDFRSSGPGPRSIDAVALESSIRLADCEARCRAVAERGESDLSSSERGELSELMASRVLEDIQVYRRSFGAAEHDQNITLSGWARATSEVLAGVRKCFPDLTLAEYLGTSIRYTFRQLGFEIEPVSRVRLLSWLAAQYSLLLEIERAKES